MTAEAAGLFLDYSKNRITNETVKLLLKLADEIDLRSRIKAISACKVAARSMTKQGPSAT
jgi:glucose-6-phosphate isomerase